MSVSCLDFIRHSTFSIHNSSFKIQHLAFNIQNSKNYDRTKRNLQMGKYG